ncbi:cytochrome P450 alkane hydroxylase [Coniochaeta sp. 2T2.1]|nr:cytochrome P450 alkane hydroxylase [Coniochaeta sp. 2T2.1]
MHYLLYVLALFVAGWGSVRRRRRQQKHGALASEHDCLPPPLLVNELPLGIDRVKQGFKALSESRFLEFCLATFRETGYTFEQNILLRQVYDTADPENLEAMLSSNVDDWNFGVRRQFTSDLLGDGIFTQEGQAWKHSRELLRPQVAYRRYEDLEVFMEPIDDLLNSLPQSGGVVDLQPIFFRFSLDVTTAFLFGKSVRSLGSEEGSPERAFADNFDTPQSYIAMRFRVAHLSRLLEGREWRKSCRWVQVFADQIIDQHLMDKQLSNGPNRGRSSLLQGVAEGCHDRATLRGQIVNMLVAGRDTTACLLSWTFFLLVRHPHVMEKLRSEVSEREVVHDQISRSDLRSMRYLQNVLKETLRLYPPTVRTSPTLILEGTLANFNIYALHRRPDLYGMDAECFRPERWDEDLPLFQQKVTRNFGYLPFGAGPRTLDFALTEAVYAVVSILLRYPAIKLPAGENVQLLGVEKQTVTLVLQSADGCRVELS